MKQGQRLSILIPVLEFGRAGGHRVLSLLADELSRLGCRVAFLAPCWSEPPHYPTEVNIYWVDALGRPAKHRPQSSTHASAVRRTWRLLSTLWGLEQGIRRAPGTWDVILANQSLTAWPVALARVGSTKAYYVQAYEPEVYDSLPGLHNKILRGVSWLSYFLPLHRIANAPLYLRYRSCLADVWVPPGLDLKLFTPVPTEAGGSRRNGAGLVVGCIGRADPGKGTLQAIQAYRQFAAANPGPHRFRLADFGVPREWLDGISGLECVVPSNDTELAGYYRSIDALLALCLWQHGAHHYPVLEAMACGVPVITTGYLPAVPSNAWIVGRDPAEAAEALEDLRRRPDSAALKIRLAEVAIQAYAWPAVARRFLEALTQLRRSADVPALCHD